MDNYFELYGISASFHPDAATVKNKYYELSRKYHPDRYTLASAEEQAEALRFSSLNNQAYNTLRDVDATMRHVLQLNELVEEEEKYSLPPAFLMEMMDLNEAISDYEMEPENKAMLESAQQLLQTHLAGWEDEVLPLTQKFDAGDRDGGLLLQIKEQYFRKKYLLRIRERINNLT